MSTQQVYELFFRATPDRVWSAMTRPEDTEQYFFGTRVAVDQRKGGAIRWAMADGMLMVDGEVQSVRPQEELVHTWRIHYDPTAAGEVSTVTWRLEPRGPVTKVTLTHDLDGAPATGKSVSTDGWSLVLSGLKTLVETGAPLPSMG
jgi:uncharacterized protein YndB with AHSA1/START domain